MRKKDEIAIPETAYADLLKTAVSQIHASRNAIAIQVNTAAVTTYWNLGKLLYDRKIEGGYGSNVIQRLSVDLKVSFPDMGLSPRNLWYMKRFYERYRTSDQKLQRAVAVLSWRINVLLIEKRLTDDEIYYYASEVIQKGWNKDLLLNAIKMNMYAAHKDEQRDNNFLRVLPSDQATLANGILQDSYNLGFLGVTEPIGELELEKRLVEKIKLFIMELGTGFSFIGNQYRVVSIKVRKNQKSSLGEHHLT